MSAGLRTWFPFGIVVGLACSVAPLPEVRLVMACFAFIALVLAAVDLVWREPA